MNIPSSERSALYGEDTTAYFRKSLLSKKSRNSSNKRYLKADFIEVKPRLYLIYKLFRIKLGLNSLLGVWDSS